MDDDREEPVLTLWTVYERPRDYPHCYVARRFEVVPGNSEPQATDDVIVAYSLATVRDSLRLHGLIPMSRNEDDEPQIVECWI